MKQEKINQVISELPWHSSLDLNGVIISLMTGQGGECHYWKISDATVKICCSVMDMELILTDLLISVSFLDKQVKEIQDDLEKLSPHTIKHTKKVRCNYPLGCK